MYHHTSNFLLFFHFRVRFSNNCPSPELYIYNDMFYVEIILEPTGTVKDVKINHQADPTITVVSFLSSFLLKQFYIHFVSKFL